MEEKKDDFDVIEISDEKVELQFGGTKLTISGILNKRHAQILIALVLAMLGYNHDAIMGVF